MKVLALGPLFLSATMCVLLAHPSHGSMTSAACVNAQSGDFTPNEYRCDDGSSETAYKVWSGPGTWGQICWLTGFTTVSANDAITEIQVAWGSASAPNNRPSIGGACNVGVWSDPNQDGDPTDAVLLHQQASVITSLGDSLQSIALSTQVGVSGIFFVGAFMINAPTSSGGHPEGEYPAAFDTGGAGYPYTWICGAGGTTSGPNPFDPASLATAQLPPAYKSTGVWLLRAVGSGDIPTIYCVAKTTSIGCVPSITYSGASSATAGSGFVIGGNQFISNKNCLLFYGTTGPFNAAFQGGILCVRSPIKRTTGTNTGGVHPPNDCSGAPALDFNLFAAGGLGGNPLLPQLVTPGTVVNAQWWGRDPGFVPPNNSQLSNAIEFTIGPR